MQITQVVTFKVSKTLEVHGSIINSRLCLTLQTEDGAVHGVIQSSKHYLSAAIS